MSLYERGSVCVCVIYGGQHTVITGTFSTRCDQEMLFHGLVIVSSFSALCELCLVWSLLSVTKCKAAVL